MLPSIERGWLRLITGANRIESPACQSCRDRFYAYIEAEFEMEMETAAARFPYLKAHLDECQWCQQFYEEMQALLLRVRESRLRKPPLEPDFDFSYLEASASKNSIWKVVEGRGVQLAKLFSELCLVVKEGLAFFDQLPSPLVAEWQVAPMRSRARDQQERVPLLSLPSREHDLSLSLSVIPPKRKEIDPTLIVKVIQLSSQVPVRARVVLRDTRYRLLESKSTHKGGLVRFANLKPARYVVDVKCQGKVFQLPITVTWQI